MGTFAGLIVMVVVGAMFMTAEYRRRLIRVTLTAAPRRGRVLAAKAVIIGVVTFGAGLVSAAIAVVLGQRVLRGNGAYVYPASALTQVRVIVGTAAVLAVAAVIALAIGTILRRGIGAVAVVVVVIVLPYMLTVAAPILPPGPTDWLLRLTLAPARRHRRDRRGRQRGGSRCTGSSRKPRSSPIIVSCGAGGLGGVPDRVIRVNRGAAAT